MKVIEETAGVHTYALRYLKPQDQFDVYEALADWQPDERGEYTWGRCVHNMSHWLKQLRHFDGQGDVALVLTEDDQFVGITRATVTGTHAEIAFEAILPEKRGQGLFTVMSRLLRVYGFETLGVRSVSYTTREDPGAVASDIQRMGAREKGQVESRSGRMLKEYEYTDQERESGMDSEEAALRERIRGTPDPDTVGGQRDPG